MSLSTTGRLDLTIWRNDDLCEIPLRVRGADLTGAPLAMQIRLYADQPGSPLCDLRETTQAGVQGIRFVRVERVAGVSISHLVIRLDVETRKALPYGGEAGDAAALEYALLIGGVTRLVGAIVIPAHSYGSDSAPLDRAMGYGIRSAPLPGAGATLTIADDNVVELAIDGADMLGERVVAAEAAANQAAIARDAVRPLIGIGGPAPTTGIEGSWYIDFAEPTAPLDYYRSGGTWTGPFSRKGNPGGNVAAIGLLAEAGQLTIPAGTTMVQTSGSSVLTRGSALYVEHPGWDFTNYPGSGFTDKSGRRFRQISDREVSVASFGAVGNGASTSAVDTLAFENAFKFYTAFYRVAAGTDRMGGAEIFTPPGDYKLTRPIIPQSANTKAQGFVLRGVAGAMTRIEWQPEDSIPDRALFYNRGLLGIQIKHINFYSTDPRNTFLRSPMTANNQQRFHFPGCEWTGRWFRGVWATGNNNNSEWIFDGNGGCSGQMRQFIYIPGIESGEDQFLNWRFRDWNMWTTHQPTAAGGIIGAVDGNTLTVTTNNVVGPIKVGMQLRHTGLATDPVITALGTGTGGVGTYLLDQSLVTALSSRPLTLASTASITGSAANGVLTVTAVARGTIEIGHGLTGTGVPAGCFVHRQIDGTAGGSGTYEIWEPATFTSRALATTPDLHNCHIDAARGGHFHLLNVDYSGWNAGRKWALRGNNHNLGVCTFTARSTRAEMKSGLVSSLYCEWPQGNVVIDAFDQSSQQQVYPAEAVAFDFVYGGTTAPGAIVAITDSQLLGLARFSHGLGAYEFKSICQFKNNDFLSHRDLFDAIRTVVSANATGAWSVEVSNCRGQQSRIFNFPYWATNTDYTVGAQRCTEVSLYQCTVAGKSAAAGLGPKGSGQDIEDGTARWKWIANTPRDYFTDAAIGGWRRTRGAQQQRTISMGPELPRSGGRYAEVILPPNFFVESVRVQSPAGAVTSGLVPSFTVATDSGTQLLAFTGPNPASQGFDARADNLAYRTGTTIASRVVRLQVGNTDQVNSQAVVLIKGVG